MAEQIPQTLHDGQAEAETPAPLTRGVVELMVLLEDRLKLPVGDANAGIPDLDAQDAAAPSATKQHLAGTGVFQCVGQQVADHLLQQPRIAQYRPRRENGGSASTSCTVNTTAARSSSKTR